MALDPDKLKDNLKEWLNPEEPYETIHDSMVAFADAYEDFAQYANDISLDVPLLTFKSAMVGVLDTITCAETASTVAVKFESALIAYWNTATFTKLFPPTGTIAPEISATVTVNIVPNSLSSVLTTIFSDLDPTKTRDEKAIELATAFYNATISIKVTCIGTLTVPPYSLAVTGNIF